MALDSVATIVKNVLQKELGVLMDYGQDLETLSSNMTVINAALEDAEQQQFSNKTTMDWLQKLKDTAYELDDLLEDCAYHDAESEHEGLKCALPHCGLLDLLCSSSLSSFHPNHFWFRYQTAKKMKKIMQKIDQIARERAYFHSPQTARERSTGVMPWRETMSTISEPQFYGRAEDRDKIVDFLVFNASHSEDLTLYPIVGQGGLGKTTLAKFIFNDPKVKEHFEPTIWVCVSEDFSLKRMLKAIIAEVSWNLDLLPLQRKLQDMLKGKRYLLVLDDVWDHDQGKWQILKSVLACGGKGASILVTSRLQQVARSMKATSGLELSKLSDGDCWLLLKEKAFEPDEEVPEDLENIGKRIVEKCGGVPLAAKALGSLLRFKRMKEDWVFVRDSKLWNLPQDENSVMPALRLSYLNLPVEVRQCFSLCALFPKDTIIEKQFLVLLWMVNGFISSNETSHAEVIGENVVNELYWNSFFKDVERDEFGKIRIFKLHDLIHDLAESAAEEVCCITDDEGVTAVSKRIRHLSIYSKKSSVEAVKYLKTFIMESDFIFEPKTCVVPPDVLKCYSLRVLKIRGLQELPSAVGRLKFLSYLDISEGSFETLPESLCELFNLEVLILDLCQRLTRLPDNLIRLTALRHLSLRKCYSLSSMPPEIGKLSCLKKISKYMVGKEEGFLLAELGQLNLQGELHIQHLERVKSVRDAQEANIRNKHLNQLWLSWDEDEECEL